VQSLGENGQPVVITQSEYMRRMKDMSRYQQGMSFYATMPDSYNLILNADHPLIKRVLEEETASVSEALKPIESEIRGMQARVDVLRQEQNKKKYDELTQEEKDELSNSEKALNDQKDKKKAVIADYAKGNKVVHQLIDLALLQNGMLKGAALDAFLKRSVDLIG
jgi:molecular chaperone HtpG